MRIGHTSAYRGKRVLVFLRNGRKFEDRFHDRNDKYVFLQEAGRVAKADLRCISILKRNGS